MKSKTIIAVGAIATALYGAAAYAQVDLGVSTSSGATTSVRVHANQREGRESATTRIAAIQGRSDAEISNRIDSLNRLIVRINSLKKVSASEKASLVATLQAEIASLTSLEATIAADTSTTSAKSDADSITKFYRIYALVMPQNEIVAAADRVLDIAADFGTTSAKIQSAIAAAQAKGTNVSAAVAAMADLSAKVADAATQANAAISEVSGLKPDNGNQSIAQSNLAALKDARAKLKAATTDLKAAQTDAHIIVATIRPSLRTDRGNDNENASTTVNASTTRE